MLQKLRFWLICKLAGSTSVVINVRITPLGVILKPKSLAVGCDITTGHHAIMNREDGSVVLGASERICNE